MAEALLRKSSEAIDVYSAGIEAHGLNPYMLKVMSEKGFDMSSHKSETIENYSNDFFDIVLTVCDYANDVCPKFKNANKHIHCSFIDPANAVGSEPEKLFVYREVRDAIEVFIKVFSSSINSVI